MKARTPFIALLAFVCSMPFENNLFSQSLDGSIAGVVLEEGGQPAEFATVMLYRQDDSTLVKGDFSDEQGFFRFESLESHIYFLQVTLVGYSDLVIPDIQMNATNPTIDLGSLRMGQNAQQLTEVIVTARKPFVERQADKLVVNVENSSIAAGNTALEVLRRAPGVTVDNNDNISLRGRQGVIVMIDGKQTYLSSTEVANLLKNMAAESIETIEIITQPSARYDAAGNAGIINIRLKKNKNEGLNGSLTTGTGAGLTWFDKYYDRGFGNLNLNYRKGKVNLFGNAGANHNNGRNDLNLKRTVVFQDTTTFFDQVSRMNHTNDNLSFKVGADYALTDRQTIGIQANGFLNHESISLANQSNIYTNDLADGGILVTNDRPGNWRNYTYNLNYRATFDSLGRELTADIDYSRFNGNSFDNILTSYLSAEGAITGTEPLRSEVPILVDIWAFKADYVHPFRNGLKLEGGVKASMVTTDNDVVFELFDDNSWVVDSTKTNHFLYKEDIAAAYLNTSRQFKKWGFQAGLRAEYTQSVGNSLTLNKVVDRDYLEFFPSLSLQYQLSENHQFGLNYSRRIDRPNYQDLNPFIYFLDPFSFVQGNPFLNPMFTHSVELSHTFKGMVNTSLNYSRTEDYITQVTIQNDTTKTTVATNYNLDTYHSYGFSISTPIPVAKWWMIQTNLNVNYRSFKAEFLGAQLDNQGLTANFYLANQISLPKGYSLELSGWYRSPEVDGIFIGRAMYMADFGLSKKILKDKGSLRLNVNDLFNTGRWRGYTKYENMDLAVDSKWQSRRVNVSFNYRFGNQNVKGPQRRNTGSDEERNRVKMDRG
ncbi:MAG: TonB-dependent receptor [Lewinellaceae bacterium]|nr:TonB-dependent receptor [Lewinellaceae bacterium]